MREKHWTKWVLLVTGLLILSLVVWPIDARLTLYISIINVILCCYILVSMVEEVKNEKK